MPNAASNHEGEARIIRNFASKREQSQTCLNYAEREQNRRRQLDGITCRDTACSVRKDKPHYADLWKSRIRAKRVKHLNKLFSFEVIKIELLDFIESNSSTSAPNHPNSQGGLIIRVAKILQNVEKSYDKGKFLLEESKKSDGWDAIFRRF